MSAEEFRRAVRDWQAAQANFDETSPDYAEAAVLDLRAAEWRLGRVYRDAKEGQERHGGICV